ncbi:molybdopterin-dependent oxidoreductase [Halomonas dongshanensis]
MYAFFSASAVMALCLMASVSLAEESAHDTRLDSPKGAVLLRISGHVTKQNAVGEAQLDHTMLTALPQHSFSTSTPWTEGVSEYTGPLMRDLLDYVGAQGESVRVMALNDYEAEIPLSDFGDYDVILALERDGREMPIREYGPLWVLYPFDQDETLLSERMRFRAVWQVMHIDVL